MNTDPQTMEIVRDIAKRVAAVKIPIGKLKSHQRLPGDRKSIHRGEGDDFDGHELYVPGDDPRSIDWNATSMTGGQQILVALYKEETHIKSTILCDVSDSMNFGTTRVTKRVLAAELAACATRSLGLTHDTVGLVTYSDSGVERRVKSGSAASMMMPVILNTLQSKATKRPDQKHGLARGLGLVSRSPSIVFVISDFINTTEADWEALKRIGRKHRLLAMYVQDLRERELPKVGWLPALYNVQDPSGVERDIWVTKRTARKHSAAFKAHEAKVLERLKECRATSVVVGTHEDAEAAPRILNFLRRSVS